MTEEAPISWYRSPLEKQELREFTERSDVRGFAQILPQLAVTIALGIAAYHALLTWPIWASIPVLYVYWTVYSFIGLSGAGHELSHGTVFKTKFWNELFINVTGFLTWTNYVHFRASHAGHHRLTVHQGRDLEVVLPLKLPWHLWVYFFTFNWRFLIDTIRMAVRHSFGILKGEWEHRIFPESAKAKRRKLAWFARTMVVGHAVMAAAFIYFGLWPLLLLVTFAPFFAGWLNFLCGFTQHAGMTPSVPDFRLSCRTVKVNPIVGFLYWQMQYHIEHHMYAAVPFWKLAKLRKRIEHDLPPACDGLVDAWKQLLAALRKQKEDPSYAYAPDLPNAKWE